jgi:hypothetical protein
MVSGWRSSRAGRWRRSHAISVLRIGETLDVRAVRVLPAQERRAAPTTPTGRLERRGVHEPYGGRLRSAGAG